MTCPVKSEGYFTRGVMRIDQVVKWRDVEALLMEHYETGRSNEGTDAYPALMLLKGLLL
jgi:hypothetical protein